MPRDKVPKADWLCKLCKGPDGKQFRNRGSRAACFKCNIAKGSCFGGKAPEKGGCPSVSSAEKKSLEARDKEIKDLKNQLKAEKEKKTSTLSNEGTGAKDSDQPAQFKEALEALRNDIKFLESLSESQRAMVQDYEAKLAAKKGELKGIQERERNGKPLEVRVENSRRWVSHCKETLERHRKSLGSLEEKLRELNQQVESKRKQVEEADTNLELAKIELASRLSELAEGCNQARAPPLVVSNVSADSKLVE